MAWSVRSTVSIEPPQVEERQASSAARPAVSCGEGEALEGALIVKGGAEPDPSMLAAVGVAPSLKTDGLRAALGVEGEIQVGLATEGAERRAGVRRILRGPPNRRGQQYRRIHTASPWIQPVAERAMLGPSARTTGKRPRGASAWRPVRRPDDRSRPPAAP